MSSVVSSPTKAISLSECNVIGHPCLAFQELIRCSQVFSAIIQGTASAYLVKRKVLGQL